MKAFAVVAGLLLLGSVVAASRPARLVEDGPAVACPSPYAPSNGRDKSVTQDGVTYQFQLQAGTFQAIGPTVPHTGRYNWNTVVDETLRARMVGAFSFAHCTQENVAGYPWTFVWDDGFSPGNVIVMYTPREEDEVCEDDMYKAPGDETIALRLRASPTAGTIVRAVCEDSPFNNNPPGSGIVTYCLYLDWYDLEGNFLYSELVTCWQAAS